jgi:hypothetical protein
MFRQSLAEIEEGAMSEKSFRASIPRLKLEDKSSLFSLAKCNPIKIRNAATRDEPKTHGSSTLYQIAVILKRISDHGMRRHPRTPVWNILAEIAHDSQMCSKAWFREEKAMAREPNQGRLVIRRKQTVA